MSQVTAEFDELAPADRAFARSARNALRASESLDYVESARLAAARRRALATLEAAPSGYWRFAPAGAALAVALLVALLPSRLSTPAQPSVPVNENMLAALEWSADEAGPDFYRDLEFYQWLSEHSEPDRHAEPNA